MLLDLVNRIGSERKVLDIEVWVLSRSTRGRPGNVLGTSQINLPGTSLEHQIKTSPGRHFRTSPGRHFRMSPGRKIGTSRDGQVGSLGDSLKIAKVVPIFKSESRVLCNNYRPISLVSNISKLIGKLMHKRVCNFLEQQNCIHIAQFDFCISFSTNNALMSVTENIQSQLDQKKFWAGVSVDL